MKKLTVLLALALCLALSLPALAQDYTPGAMLSQLAGEALLSGKMVGGDMVITLDMDEQMLSSDPEEQKIIAMVEDVLAHTQLAAAIGMPADAPRLELGAAYSTDAGSVSVKAAAEATLDGLSVESDLIPGEKVTMKWETLMELAGMSRSDIETIMSLKEFDFEAAAAEMMAQIEPIAAEVGPALIPYAETIMTYIAALPMETEENIAATEERPAAALRTSITVTEKNVGELITLLADQLEKDAVLTPYVDKILAAAAEQDPSMIRSAKELCAQLRALAGKMTGTVPVIFSISFDEAGMPMALDVFAEAEDKSSFLFSIEGYPYPDDENAYTGCIAMSVFDAGAQETISFAISGVLGIDPADPNVCSFAMAMSGFENDEEMLNMEMVIDVTPVEDSLPGYESAVSMQMDVNEEGETVSMQMTGVGLTQMTAEGGEYISSGVEMTMNVGGEAIGQTTTEEMIVTPTADGFTAQFVSTQVSPAAGMNMTVTGNAVSWTHTPQALTELAFEDASQEDLQALLARVSQSGMSKAGQLMGLLPTEFMQLIMENM